MAEHARDTKAATQTSPTASRWVNSGPSDDLAWSVLGTLLAGPLTWGLIGALVDRWQDTEPAFLIAGLLLGAVGSFYIVWVRHFRVEPADASKQQGDSR